ncbi:MAG TPA: DUF3376 domain-containing protein, partial [Pyrinomonadaceae bacterium]|nr:DUF3376 domain-containing protein [Pyrinomonadaceae bacterium]
ALGRKDKPNVRREADLIWRIVETALRKLIGLEHEPAQLLERALQESAETLRPMDSDTLSAFNAALKKRRKEIIEELASGKIREEKEHETKEERRQTTADDFKGIFQRTRVFEEEFLWKALSNDDEDERNVLLAYSEFEKIDVQLYPIEWVAELHEKDIIETIRISPRDAERGFSRRGLSDKVSGDAMYHFGGFFKRSWRSNDILWGRLDSACQLVETLLDPKRIADVLKNPGQAAKIRARFFDNEPEDGRAPRGTPKWKHEMEPATLFPNAGQKTQDELKGWLEQLLWYVPLGIDPAQAQNPEPRADDEGEAERTPAQAEEERERRREKLREGIDALLGKEKFPEKLERIIEATQLEILHEDLPNVITDALEEQAKWNQFTYPRRESSNGKAKKKHAQARGQQRGTAAAATPDGGNGDAVDETYPFFFKPAGGDIDPFVSVLAAAGAAREEMNRFKSESTNARTPMETPLGLFFSKDYKVGSEVLTRDIPILVLMEILSVTLLVLRNCMLKIFGSNADRIKAHPLYLFMIDFPLRAFNTLVLFLRRVPGASRYLWISVAVLSAFALFVGIVWRRPIIWSRDGLHLAWLIPLVVVPSLVLGTMAVYLWRGRVSDRSLSRAALYFVIAALILSPFFVSVVAYQEVYQSATRAVLAWGSDFNFLGRPYELSHTGAQLIVIAACVVTLLGPWVAMPVLWLLSQRRRTRPRELRRLLERHFSISEMLIIARRLNLFDEDEMTSMAAQLKLFDDEQLQAIGESVHVELKPEAEGAGEQQAQRVSYAEILEQVKAAERRDKAAAYKALGERLDKLDAERRRVALDGLAAAQEATDEARLKAFDETLKEVRSIEERRRRLATSVIQSAQRAAETEEAGVFLAARIVERARERERATAEEGAPRPRSVLAELEDLMYSINPEVMRGI